ncbi:restriction endonuclease subunit S [Curtobacterium sp. ME12]|uniref:restriction endonuclease subunit S n=1 Tax=Curtobacterium sp. ME12 TaxID=2744253 RepID=UPI0021756517|nr:restriction endonuclease subunit S [Curtobacterium sp. ME12]
MTDGWTPTRLGEVVKIKHGFAFSGMAENPDSSLPVVVGIGNFDYAGGFRFNSTTVKRYVGEYPSEFVLKPGDVLLAMTCQTAGGEILGIPGTVPDDGRTYLHNQRLGKVEVIDSTRIDLRYFFQLARWQPFNHHLFATASGSKILHTSPGRIEDFTVDLPPLPEQRAIAAALGVIDDKIESDRRLIGLIPQLIRSRVEKYLAGGANEAPVSSLARFVNGGAYTKGATGFGRMVIRIAELNSGPGSSTVYNELDVPEDRTARAGDVLMSWSGSLGVYRWARDEAIINQHIFKVIPTGYPAWLVHDRIDAVIDVFRGYAADKATTMGHIRRGDLDTTTVQLPREGSLRELDAALGPVWNRLLIAEQEVPRLEAVRDAILPELLSGRIRVPEAQGLKA